MPQIHSAISCNLDQHILAAALPLFESEKVEAIEWSFDALYNLHQIPGWFTDLLATFGNEGRLIGHGVFFSLFSGGWSKPQQDWLDHLRTISRQFPFDHISEHFGFMTGEDFHKGAPLGIPFNKSTLAIGRDRLARIAEACNCPVGLENLAFSYSPREVGEQGEFLEQLLAPVNGFLILDLHNVYCQSHNFAINAVELIKHYPLNRVREIHISGGSWEQSHVEPGKLIRRDTHDDSVPQEVFELLAATIPCCPQLKFVVLEQLGSGLDTAEKRTAFQQDFACMDQLLKKATVAATVEKLNDFMPPMSTALAAPVTDDQLLSQQRLLSDILETAGNYEKAKGMLQSSTLADTDWRVENWSPYMLETAISIAQKWKHGWSAR